MLMKLDDQVAIITGAGSGIGRATAILFAKEGASVIIAARGDNGKDTESMIKERGGKALFIKTDVRKESSVKAMVAKAVKAFGKVDILVNNAGILKGSDVTQTDESLWDEILDTNLKGTFLCSKHTIPFMRKHARGRVVNVASELGITGAPGLAAYCASKGAVINLTKAMALDYARVGIRVNCVSPGPIDTPMLQRMGKVENFGKMTPMGRAGMPSEVAQVILFLASDESSYVTGANYSVDGGDTAGTI